MWLSWRRYKYLKLITINQVLCIRDDTSVVIYMPASSKSSGQSTRLEFGPIQTYNSKLPAVVNFFRLISIIIEKGKICAVTSLSKVVQKCQKRTILTNRTFDGAFKGKKVPSVILASTVQVKRTVKSSEFLWYVLQQELALR